MAVPTIIRVLPYGSVVGDPAVGPTAGRQLVEIYGNNFRLPSTAPITPTGSIVRAPVPKTVSVTFGGKEALSVEVITPILLRVVTPISPIADSGVGPVDVTVSNLDDAEVLIPGETVTLVDGYEYQHVKLDSLTECDFSRLVRQLIQELKRQVLLNVILTVDTDFDVDTSTAFVEVAELPALVLQGPDTPENRFYSINDRNETYEDGVVKIQRKPRTIDLLFDVVGISDHPVEILNLMALTTLFVEMNPYIELVKDPDDPSKGTVEYEFDFQDGSGFNLSNRPNNSNINSFTGSVIIRGFDFEGFAGFPKSAIRALAQRLNDEEGVALDVQSM